MELHSAAHHGNLKKLKKLLDQGADPSAYCDAADDDGRHTPLMAAITERQYACVELLLKRGAQPDGSLPGDRLAAVTPLMIACMLGDDRSAKLLIDAHATLNAADPESFTALHHACHAGHAGCVSLLLAHLVDRTRLCSGMTALEMARSLSNNACVRAFDTATRRVQEAAADSAERERQEREHAELQAKVDAQRAAAAALLEKQRLAIQAETDAKLAAAHAVEEARVAEAASEQQQRHATEREEQRRAFAARKSKEEEDARQKQELQSQREAEEEARRKAQLKEKSEAKKQKSLDKKGKKKALSAFALQAQQEQLAREERLEEEARAAQLAAQLAQSGAAEAGATSSSVDQASVEEHAVGGASFNSMASSSTAFGEAFEELTVVYTPPSEEVPLSEEVPPNAIGESALASEASSDHGLCIVCWVEPRTHLIFPCGHKCLCEACSTTIGEQCPMCRGPNVGVCRVFA